MKTLKFTPEMLKKHLKYNEEHGSKRLVILTTRDECKGKYGDLFHIEGLKNPFVLVSLEDFDSLCAYAQFCVNHYDEEGFDTPDELLKTIIGFYPNATKLYAHTLFECFDEGD